MKKIIISCAIISIVLFGCSQETVKVVKEEVTIELGENPYEIKKDKLIQNYEELFKDKTFTKVGMTLYKGKTKITKQRLIEKNDLSVGDYTLKLKISTKDSVKKLSVKVKVKDTKAPKFINLKNTIRIEQGAKDVDYKKYFTVEDLSEFELKVSSKKVDLNIIGEYEIKIEAIDKYKNKSSETIAVHVVSLEDALASGIGEMNDGTKPQSEAMTQRTQEQTNTSSGNANGNGNSQNQGGNTPPPIQPSNPVYRSDIASSYVSQINSWRQQNGLPTLPVTDEAQVEANMRAEQLISSYGHNSSSGFIENIGMGDVGYNFFEAWKNSPGHNGKMLEGSMFTGFAVSVIEYNGKWYAVTSFRTAY